MIVEEIIMKNSTIKSLSIVVSSLLVCSVFVLPSPAQARDRQKNTQVEYAYATVLSAEPIHKRFLITKPEQQCFEKQVSVATEPRRSRTNHLLGTIIGAAIGNAVGHKKSNKLVGVYAGGLLGGAIADDISRESTTYNQQLVTECETVNVEYSQTRVIGYRVSYLFNGETYTTRLKRDPGNSLRVRTTVTPLNH